LATNGQWRASCTKGHRCSIAMKRCRLATRLDHSSAQGMKMNWIDECKLAWRGKLTDDATELERLVQLLGVSQFDLWVTKNNHTGFNTYEAQKRIREELNFRCRMRLAIGGAIGALFVWLMRAFVF
jgi:hypothetical protein